MSRRAHSETSAWASAAKQWNVGPAPAPPTPPDDYFGRLVKYIPAEIIAVYIAVALVIPKPAAALPIVNEPARASVPAALWWDFWLCLVLTPVYLYVITRNPSKATPYMQMAIATFAFAVWAFAMPDGPFRLLRPDYIASIVLIFTTFVVGMIKPNRGA